MNASSHLLDTSFLVRLLTRDPLQLFKEAAAFLDRWTPAMPGLVVTDLVPAEAYFALQHHYGYPKSQALAALHALASQSSIAVADETLAILSLPVLASARPGFVDRLIHGGAQASGFTLVTFAESARKLHGTLVLAG